MTAEGRKGGCTELGKKTVQALVTGRVLGNKPFGPEISEMPGSGAITLVTVCRGNPHRCLISLAKGWRILTLLARIRTETPGRA